VRWAIVAAALTLMAVAPGLLIRCGHVSTGCVHGPKGRLITARTSTGTRTLDLGQLVLVRRYLVAGKKSTDNLLLVDARGIRLFLDDPAVDRAVRDALIRQRSNPDRFPAVKASRFARERLGLETLPAGYRRRRSVLAVLLPVLLLPAALVVLVAVFMLIAKG
jgi:hypothetical protein